ncbi:MAG: hypothetical protein H6833_00290 [Planctomycetes bacterium]|nr:hypothetical protein [Planctomycetota bacterium]
MKLAVAALATSLFSAPAIAGDKTYWPSDTVGDQWAAIYPDPSAFLFFDSSNKHLETYAWEGTDRSFVQYTNGTARLRGTVASVNNWNRRFTVDLMLSGYTGTAPKDSPYLYGLKSSALIKNGGPIDPSSWRYYTTMNGTLGGMGDLTGWKVALTRTGPAFQMGVGANLRSIHNGASGWFTTKVLSRGAKWWLNAPWGDYNFNLDPGPGDCIAYYPFDHNKPESCDEEPCSDALNVSGGTKYFLDLYELELRYDYWYASSRTSSKYPTAWIEVAVDPKTGCQMTNSSICFDLWRDNGSAIRYVDVRIDEDRSTSAGDNFQTIVKSLTLSPTDKWSRWETFCIDLSGISELQDVTKPYAVRLYFYGTPTSGSRTTTRLDNLALCGKGEPCKKPTITRIDNPKLELVTTNCFRVIGTDMNQVTDVRINGKMISSMNSNDFGTTGYFVKVDNSTFCVYPPLCMEGKFSLEVRNSNCGSAWTGSASVSLVQPSGNRLATTPEQDFDADWCAFVYGKNVNNYYCVFASPYNKRSYLPGIIDLGIGDNFSLLIAFDSPGPKCFPWCVGKWPSVVKGMTLYFQSLVVDLDNFTQLPLEVTNVTQTYFR